MAPHVTGELNAVLGDRPFERARGRAPGSNDTDVDRIQAHLCHVAASLRARPEVDKAIPALIDSYCHRAVFPSRFTYPDVNAKRIPCFVDDAGTHCALGQLLKETGEAELAQRINAAHRFRYVDEIVAEAEADTVDALVAWGVRHGLDAVDFATIQPTYGMVGPVDDLPVLGPTHNATCDNCYSTIIGIRYKCSMCADYDLCQTCMKNDPHNVDHVFLKLRQPATDLPTGVVLIEDDIYDPTVALPMTLPVEGGPPTLIPLGGIPVDVPENEPTPFIEPQSVPRGAGALDPYDVVED